MSNKNHYQVMMGSYTIGEFVKQIDMAYNSEGEETGQGILIAPFQRHYKWHAEEHPRFLLDSLNRNIFVMPVILAEMKGQTWIIDGQQRLATLYCYMQGYQPESTDPIEWKKLIVDIKKIKEGTDNLDYKKCIWSDLEGKEFCSKLIEETPIGYSFIFNTDNEDDKPLLVDIFDRINNQGTPLKPIETIRAYEWLSQGLSELLNILKDDSFLYAKFAHVYSYIMKKEVDEDGLFSPDLNQSHIKFFKDVCSKQIIIDPNILFKLNEFVEVYTDIDNKGKFNYEVHNIRLYQHSLIGDPYIHDEDYMDLEDTGLHRDYQMEMAYFRINMKSYIISPVLYLYLSEKINMKEVDDILMDKAKIYEYLDTLARIDKTIPQISKLVKIFCSTWSIDINE